MSNPWLVGPAILALLLMSVLLPVICVVYGFAAWTFRRYRAGRIFLCPETGKRAEVVIDAIRAALSSTVGQPCLRIQDCSLWSEGRACGQACLRLAPH